MTFQETGGRTRLTVHDLYPSKEALDAAIASGSTSGMPEALDQLDELLATLSASAAGHEAPIDARPDNQPVRRGLSPWA